MTDGRQTLGKGLGALLPAPQYAAHRDDYFLCPVAELHADPDQPRQHFDDTALEELVVSVREKGILQPLVVRSNPDGPGYLLVAGERRLRAARRLHLRDVPVLVKEVASDEAFELALIENIQREDLNPIEEALAYQRLLAREGMTQAVIANRLGKSRSALANALRLLTLGPEVKALVASGQLSAGHGRTLLVLSDPERRMALAQRALHEALSVREVERIAKQMARGESTPRAARRESPLAPYLESLAEEISGALGLAATVKLRGRTGKLTLHFHGVEQLRSLRDRLVTED
ncbi:MAG: ParB/RepB/Spo0J family partition protein [Myxococcota bacterium]|nr:ParB/RepB/Spo0J family partition protein [Myxococcota bacterium]